MRRSAHYVLGFVLLFSTAGALATPTAWQLLDDGDPPPRNAAPVLDYDTLRDVAVQVDGSGDGPPRTWELHGDDWVRKFIPEPTPWNSAAACGAYDSQRGVFVIFGGVIPGVGISDETWEYDGASWTQVLTTTTPPQRLQCGMVYDESVQRIVMFGGYLTGLDALGDGWEYDGVDWTEIVPGGSGVAPSPRGEPAIAYDSVNDIVLMFGGRSQNFFLPDTWELDTSRQRWRDRSPQTGPSARAGSGLAFDATTGKSILFAGLGLSGDLGDTWEWDGSTWTEKAPLVSPPPRGTTSAYFDPGRGQVVVHGGDSTNDTWAFDGSTWTQIALSGVPANRYDFAMVHDPRSGKVIAYGGASNEPDYSDTWAFANGSWTELVGAGAPTAARGLPITFDPIEQRIVGFSGRAFGGGAFQDLHTFADPLEVWTSTATCCLEARYHHGFTWAPSLGGSVLFGGFVFDGVSFDESNDTWILEGSQWTAISTSTQPSTRMLFGLAHHDGTGNSVLYGGWRSSTGSQPDTWLFDGVDWQLHDANSPPGKRSTHRLVYDANRDVIVLFGDGDVLDAVTWEFDGVQWTAQPTPILPDPIRQWHGFVYDEANEVSILFGGRQGGSSVYMNDTWAYGADPDGDGIVGLLDNCVDSPNGDQANADGDVAGDVCDCASGDPGAFAQPVVVSGLVVDGDDVSWDDQAAQVGDDVTYDLVRGNLSDLRSSGDFMLANCRAGGLVTPSYTDVDLPAAGDGFYYVARAQNVCGVGSYGAEHPGLDAASPCP